jgi:anti-anti-sigma factor
MPESPIVAVEELPGVVVIHILTDALDDEQSRRLQTEVRAAADANPAFACVVDFAQVSFLPSLSLAALVRLHSEFRSRQQRLIFAGLQPQLRDLFVMTRLDRLFELQEDVAAAVRALGPA